MCGVKPHVLRYWEQEFKQLRPMKRRGNRRYYQHHEVLIVRKIRELLYDQGFTITGARNQLQDFAQVEPPDRQFCDETSPGNPNFQSASALMRDSSGIAANFEQIFPEINGEVSAASLAQGLQRMRRELIEISVLLNPA